MHTHIEKQKKKSGE
jgi:hypothetical protein